jgi:GST-like protein
LWRHVERSITPDPWFLGSKFSALDIYVTVMNHWRPNASWFATQCPKLSAIAEAGRGLSALQKVWSRNRMLD